MENYKVGSIIKGTITGVENYGIFVSLDNYYSGLIHISEISKEYVKNVGDYGAIGETIYVKILAVDNETNQMQLSIKDINYRIGNSIFRKMIKETGGGFLPLQTNLQKWIDAKIAEMT